jgi:hypothetical protein
LRDGLDTVFVIFENDVRPLLLVLLLLMFRRRRGLVFLEQLFSRYLLAFVATRMLVPTAPVNSGHTVGTAWMLSAHLDT